MNKAVIVDDNKYDILILEKLLKINKITEDIISFSTPIVALNDIQSLKLSREDYLFIDIMMPEFSGYDLLDKLVEQKVDLTQTNVILVSSTIDPRDIDKAKNYEYVQRLLQKPITSKMLLDALRT